MTVGLFKRVAHGLGGRKSLPLSKICLTYPTMNCTLRKEDPKNMTYVTYHLSSTDISMFSLKMSKFAIPKNTDIDCI